MGQALLSEIRENLQLKRESFRLQGILHLTKSNPAFCDAILLRDLALENEVSTWIQERSSFEQIMMTYQDHSEFPISELSPDHFAMRVLSGKGAICSGRNIFLFFPNCLGLSSNESTESFGIELIDVWRNVFEKVVFPCARQILSEKSLIALIPNLVQSLDKTIYLASLFHEVGHRVGSWKVSPEPHANLKVSSFLLDALGEIATDSLLVRNLSAFSEISAFVTLQRIFWFGRRGYADNPRAAWINQDNDSWISAYLWNELNRKGLIQIDGQKWNLDTEALPEFYNKIFTEIEKLGQKVLLQTNGKLQDSLVMDWMKTKVEWNKTEGFVLDPSLQKVFSNCSYITEIPQFHPVLNLNHEEFI